METFCAVGDQQLCDLIAKAQKRIVYVAAGISGVVAEALKKKLGASQDIDLTIVVDPDEDVCRLGYGDKDGLKTIQSLVAEYNVPIRKQKGLRIGVLLVDDEVLLWAPTPQSVEAAPTDRGQPNGLRLGKDPVSALEKAIAPEGTNTVPSAGEIGKTAVTPAEVKEAIKAIEANPIIPVALSQVTRVFSSKLQFVELEVTNAKLSRAGLTIPKDQLNADASAQLRRLIDGRLRAFGDLRTRGVPVPAFTRAGVQSCGPDGRQLTEPMSEADLDSRRREIERQFLYHIHDHGTLIARDQKQVFEACVRALELQLKAHATGLKDVLRAQAPAIVEDAVELLASRARNAAWGAGDIDTEALRESLRASIDRVVDGEPAVKWRYKDVTYEHTKDEEFRKLVRKALPAEVQARLGNWDVHYQAAKERAPAARGQAST